MRRLGGRSLLNCVLCARRVDVQYRGEFEERLKSLLKEVVDAGNIILFIDEIHTYVAEGEGGSCGCEPWLTPCFVAD